MCEIQLSDVNILVVAVYRRPHRLVHFDKFFAELSKFRPLYDVCIIAGDFNTNFDTMDATTQALVTHFDDLNITRLPIMHTHLSYNSLTTIDAIFVSTSCDINHFGKLHNPLSHHEILYTILHISTPNSLPAVKLIREFNSIDSDLLLTHALTVDWSACGILGTVDEKVEKLN